MKDLDLIADTIELMDIHVNTCDYMSFQNTLELHLNSVDSCLSIKEAVSKLTHLQALKLYVALAQYKYDLSFYEALRL